MAKKQRFFSKDIIYRAKKRHVYHNFKEYDCYNPVRSVNSKDFYTVDCWICDEQGNVVPELSHNPIPVNLAYIGDAVADNQHGRART